MGTLTAINMVAHIADTCFKFATHTWTKKSIIQLAVVTGVIVGSALIIKALDEEDGKKNEK